MLTRYERFTASIAGISRSRKEEDLARISYYQSALEEVREMRNQYERT